MTFRITVLPASSKAGKETIRNLLESDAKPFIHGIYRDLSKVPAEFANNERFEATQGDVGAGTGLDFSRSNALFYVPPPTYDGTDQGEWGIKTATNVKEALGKAPDVKKLLLFSSMGAQYDHGIGLLRLNHISDNILKDSVPEVVIVKPGYFQENWSHAFETIQAEPPVIYSVITPLEHKIPMVSIRDIGRACGDALLAAPKDVSPYYFDLYGPRHYSALDVKEAVEGITGKKVEVVPIEKDNLAEFFARDIPSAHIEDFVGMTTSALPGGIMAGDFGTNERTVQGKVELVEALRPLYTK